MESLAGIAQFTRPTDTILVPGHLSVSSEITIETQVKFAEIPGDGRIFSEQRSGETDKQLGAFPATGGIGIWGNAWTPQDSGWFATSGMNLLDGQWHHIAFERWNNTWRTYVDGQLKAVRPVSATPIANSSSSWMSVGAFLYTFTTPVTDFRASFIGALDWIRVSSIARYTDATFSIPTEPAPDQYTELLYDFNDETSSSTVQDSSSNHWDGQLGIGHFPDATSPTLFSGLSIHRQPQSLLGYWGKSVSFTVTVTNGLPPYAYQWRKAGTDILGATNSSLALANLQLADAGTYAVLVSDTVTNLLSQPATLTVNPAGVSIALYAGVTIDGVVGLTYGVQSTTDLGNTNSWIGRANIILAAPVQLWFDTQPASHPQRYYRVVPGPISIP